MYTGYHFHSDLSSGTTNIDSVTKYKQYIDRAKELGMKAFGFSEHGNIFEWYHKKCDIEAAGMKYIHACECYVTENLTEKVRDNYHCVLIAKNFEGFKELNRLVAKSFDKNDGHFYYTPRITFEELVNTTDNIIITTACLGGILHNAPDKLQQQFIQFLAENKERCYLEIQHHSDVDGEQKAYNIKLYELSQKFGIPLIAGTDTHALNQLHEEARVVLQKGKGVHFANEDSWDLKFHTYEELCKAYKLQGALPEDVYLEAIENTNHMADKIEEFQLDRNTKYPKLYDNSYETFRKQINAKWKRHPYIRQRYTKEFVKERVLDELDTYDKTGCIDFMLLQTYLRDWERKKSIQCGYGRGSVSGSLISYILGVTEMDSVKFDLNFFRFLNPARVTLADIDTDYSAKDRDTVKEFILKDHMGLDNIKSAEIITFNTIKTKGAIRDICRALYKNEDDKDDKEYLKIADYISTNVEDKLEQMRSEYPEVFKWVDIVTGVIVSIGSHPSGVLVSDKNIEEMIGLCSLSKSKYPVSMLNMKELDTLMYVKLDILGLDTIGVINEACRLAGIERLNPDNTPLDDEDVWKSIRDDTTGIFQWESSSASAYIKKFMSDETVEKAKLKNENFSWIKWFSFGNGLLRPGSASYRNEVANGGFYENGLKELDDFLAPTMGRLCMQEDIMQFLVKFCGYSQAESDTVRRGIAKKYGTEQLLPEIERRFIEYTSEHYNVEKEKCKEIIKPFLQVILDASDYSFSWNHSDSYSCIGYIAGYLRYYYPYEFLTAALNIFEENEEKTKNIINYAQKINIPIQGIKFRYSQAEYTYDAETKTIYKGLSSIKYLNKRISRELYELRNNKYSNFIALLTDIKEETTVNSRQLEILIHLDFFSEFGDIHQLLRDVYIFDTFFGRKTFKHVELLNVGIDLDTIEKLGGIITEKQVKVDADALLSLLTEKSVEKKTTIREKIQYELDHLGYINIKIPDCSPQYVYVVDVNKKYKNKTVKLYRLNNGEIETVKIKGPVYDRCPINKGDVIKTIEASNEKKWKPDGNGGFIQIDELETILRSWKMVN